MKKYSELTKAEKRVRIAKDVLRQIAVKKYRIETGEYIRIDLPSTVDSDDDIKTNFHKIKKCKVCAMGACLLSITKFENKLNFSDVDDVQLLYSKTVKKLFSVFTPKQLLLIENTFEGKNYSATALRVGINMFGLSGYCTEKALGFHVTYENDTQRLVAIMKNIIKNKGTFIL